MNEILWLGIAWICGIFLGAFFFGGLQWTIGRLQTSKRPLSLFFISLFIRMTVVLTAFYFLGRGHWERIVACLVGFVMARFILTWLILQFSAGHDKRLERGTGNAPES